MTVQTKPVRWQDFEVATATPKKDLREAVKAAIRANPQEFDMNLWDCGTTACLAGWAGRLTGDRFPSEADVSDKSYNEIYLSWKSRQANKLGVNTSVFHTHVYGVENACALLDNGAIED